MDPSSIITANLQKESHPQLKSRVDAGVDDCAKEDENGKSSFVLAHHLEGNSFHIPQDDRVLHQAIFVEAIENHKYKTNRQSIYLKFKCSINSDKFENILSYQKAMDYIKKDADNPFVWKFKRSIAHQSLLDSLSSHYQGSNLSVQIEWENGEIFDNVLSTIAIDWHERLADCMHNEGWPPCQAEPDIWMRKQGTHYEYIAVYVDDLTLAMENPESFIQLLKDKYNFNFKGTGPLTFQLGADFYCNTDGILCMASKKYIECLIASYEHIFRKKPTVNAYSPLEKGDHPELDSLELLDAEGITQYQSLIGSLQWAISLGRFDIATAVMSMSSFRAAPRRGHLDRVRRICGYLAKMKHGTLKFRVHEPAYSDLPSKAYDWTYIYQGAKENSPEGAPEPLGKSVTLTHYVDANLFHDALTGRSVTGILHFANATPVEWYSKKQATVETATYGSEFVAARVCVEQIIDIRNTLQYLGVPVQACSYMFGDNESVVNSSSIPHAKLHKRHTALSFHRVREAIAAKYVSFNFLPGSDNPADILSKHWAYSATWHMLQYLLFWEGDPAMATSKEE